MTTDLVATRLLEAGQPVAFEDFRSTLEHVLRENAHLAEELGNVSQMLAREDFGWLTIAGAADNYGMELYEIQEWALQIREAMVGNPHMKRGHLLRSSFVWNDNIRYTNVPGTQTGRGANVQARIDLAANQRTFFGAQARQEREGALYSDGNYYVIGDKRDWSLVPMPIWEIGGDYRNPKIPSEIWAYKRTWTTSLPYTPTLASASVWIRTDAMPAEATSLDLMGVIEPVDPNLIIFNGKVNSQVGFAYGIPDALSALIWSRIYKDFLINGKVMSDALAQFAFQATFGNQATASGASMTIADGGAGLTAVTGVADKLVPMNSAGKGYDFTSGTALAAVIATSIEVSVIHLTSDPGTAGGSYGSAQTLDLPTQLAIKARRQWHIDFDKRILAWLGAPNAEASFQPMMDPTDIYRLVQAYVMKWSTGLYTPEEIKGDIEALFGRIATAVPEGVLLPNNSASWQDHLTVRDTVDGDPETLNQLPVNVSAPGAPPAQVPKGTPGQGQNSAAGKSPQSNDLRTDSVAEMMKLVQEFGKTLDEWEKDHRKN